MSTLTPGSRTSKKKIDFLNKIMNKKELNSLLSGIYDDFGGAKTGMVANSLKDLGFKYATLAGVTISISDLTIPDEKKDILGRAEDQIDSAQHRFNKGEITEVERYSKVIDTWSQATEELTTMVVDRFDRLNPVYMMAFSGARGNISQVRQLVGMRGLMADAQGQIIDLPIKTNFREGLSVTDYIISSYGARKGLVDTALKTADSGYLTRRLVDVAQDVIIEEHDCGTTNGIMMAGIIDGSKVIVSLEARLMGRTSAVNIANADGEILVQSGEVITPKKAQEIEKEGIKGVVVRSGLTCVSPFGVCQKCYGWSLTSNKLVDLGEAIGIMAAQSIGEPGTQLTMRTFHTGGVFSGSTRLDQVKSAKGGTVVETVPVREFRTRHGENVHVATRDFTLEIKTDSGKIEKHNLPYNATLFFYTKGDVVQPGQVISEFEPGVGRGDSRRLTEKAAKDIKADLPGQILFDNFDADEKRDRQGNITRTANRGGTIWVLGGEVYNLPAGSKLTVEDGAEVKAEDILAETLVVSEHGGEVRVPEDLITESLKIHGEKIEKITDGKELTIVIASMVPSNATIEQTKKEALWHVDASEETYVIKSPIGTMVEHGSIIAELIDETTSVTSSGEIRYSDIEVDEQRVITKAGTVYFIPEEIHPVSKDASLKMVESGIFVEAGTEIVKDIFNRISGIVEILEDNDIIQEVIVRPGELHRVKDVGSITVDDGTVVEAGTEVAPGIVAEVRSMITILFQIQNPGDDDDMDDLAETSNYEYADLLVRPVQEYHLAPRDVGIAFDSTEEHIKLLPMTQLAYKDGDKIRNMEGAPLTRTSLVLDMSDYLGRLKGIVETDIKTDNLKIAVLENLIIRRESTGEGAKATGSIQTQLLVKHGDIIDAKTPVVKTQVLAKNNGQVSLPHTTKEARRLLLVTEQYKESIALSSKPTVKVGDYVRMDEALSANDHAEISGKVLSVTGQNIVLREGHPYLISPGTLLQVENTSLVQRGDAIATLIFERQKSGDIVQGLPRVEELLEGRKSKETAVLASYDAVAEIEWEDDAPKLYLVSQDYGRQEVSMPVGANILVEDKEQVTLGQALTDGTINPHDIVEISGVEAARKYLVDEVQRVYRSQGVEIADKHVEIIVRQMSKKVKVDEPGDTKFLSGELLDEKHVLAENIRVAQDVPDGVEATYHSVLLGITKASLNTDSFISAASFQETTRVLTEAAVEGKLDILRGLKENVIIGRLIPAGTGFPHFKDERHEMLGDESSASRFTARKPSAILEEIESMFGSPEISQDTMGSFLLDEEDIVIGDGASILTEDGEYLVEDVTEED
jgi:DNA-directed RNA polymerase subunit beta'